MSDHRTVRERVAALLAREGHLRPHDLADALDRTHLLRPEPMDDNTSTQDQRTPGQVAEDAWGDRNTDRSTRTAPWDALAAAVLAHDAAARTARGEVVVARADLLSRLDVTDDWRAAEDHLRAALDAHIPQTLVEYGDPFTPADLGQVSP